MTSRLTAHGLLALWLMSLLGGCGGSGEGARPGATAAPGARSGSARRVHFVGFDANEPLINALRQGKIEGLVVQNPYKMGEMAVRTLVDHLEKKPVEREIATGETLVTPENLDDPDVKILLNPPHAENRSEGSLSGSKTKTWRVMVIPKGTTHLFWMTIHAGR